MTKIKFLLLLHEKLSDLPQEDVEERLSFYSEMIEDRMEEGLSEEDAVSAVGSVDEIAAQIISDLSPAKPINEKRNTKRKLKAWEIVLLVLGSPIWFSLLVAAFAIAVSLYASLWAVIVSFWAVFVSVSTVILYGVIAGTVLALTGNILTGIALFSAGLFCAGLSICLFFGCKAATMGGALLTKMIAGFIKKAFTGKEAA
jgi:uncharacterized membrane protein